MSTTAAPEILDLDTILPPARIVKLAGKEIDVSTVPARTALGIIRDRERLQEGSEESIDLLLDYTAQVCAGSFPGQTDKEVREWLIENIRDMNQLLRLVEFALEPLRTGDKEEEKEVGDAKNRRRR